MMNLSRISSDTRQVEEQLSGFHKEMHEALIQQHGVRRGMKRFRWLSATIWLEEQRQEPEAQAQRYPEVGIIRSEISDEVKAIQSDYGNLCLVGLVLFLTLLSGWLLFQDVITARLTLLSLSALAVGCMILYPIGVYTYWNRSAIHPFKGMKLGFGTIGSLGAIAGVYALSILERQNPFFDVLILPTFNMTEFLILVNMAVFLSFIIHFRRLNLFDELCGNYKVHMPAFSDLSLDFQAEVNRHMGGLDVIPLKTQTKRRLKKKILEEYIKSGRVDDKAVKDFIRENCISMSWMYWSGSAVQLSIIILLISKLIWARDMGLIVSTDYFRQQLTTGMVMGAILLSAGVFCPLNYCFREILYQGAVFSMKQAWFLIGQALLCVSLVLFSGLIPSRFVWGIPVNPAPQPWAFMSLLGLILLLQFFKSDQRFHTFEKE